MPNELTQMTNNLGEKNVKQLVVNLNTGICYLRRHSSLWLLLSDHFKDKPEKT